MPFLNSCDCSCPFLGFFWINNARLTIREVSCGLSKAWILAHKNRKTCGECLDRGQQDQSPPPARAWLPDQLRKATSSFHLIFYTFFNEQLIFSNTKLEELSSFVVFSLKHPQIWVDKMVPWALCKQKPWRQCRSLLAWSLLEHCGRTTTLWSQNPL